jgi:hypothetical protein
VTQLLPAVTPTALHAATVRGRGPAVDRRPHASLEKLSPEDTALREIAEDKITGELAMVEELATRHGEIQRD